MEIGQRLKQARLEAGLSQRQLCGETITRNMLSQIENGTARPSMDTLRDLAGRLGKPMSYFLDEQAVLSPNQTCIARARECTPAQALEELKHYQAPDALFDRERYLLEALACLDLAQEAIGDNRNGYAAALLQQAETAGAQTPYYTPELEHRRLLLCGQTKHHTAQELVKKLPLLDAELQLRAQAALDAGEPARCRDLLHHRKTGIHSGSISLQRATFSRRITRRLLPTTGGQRRNGRSGSVRGWSTASASSAITVWHMNTPASNVHCKWFVNKF